MKAKNETRILGNSTAQIEHAMGLLGGFHCLIMCFKWSIIYVQRMLLTGQRS